MKKCTAIIILSALLFSCSQTKKNKKEEIQVFVAASMIDVMTALTASYKSTTKVEIHMNYASSGILAKQIESGADAHIYISANEAWMDFVKERALVDTSSVKTFLKNSLVFIQPIDAVNKIKWQHGFPEFGGRIAIGDPTHVPAGKYATEALKNLDWYEKLKTRLAPAMDVRAALMLVELGECNLGIVYLTDAIRSKRVQISDTIPASLCPEINYSIAKTLKNSEEAEKFYRFLLSDDALLFWEKFGFMPY